jgi:hypothetical protein
MCCFNKAWGFLIVTQSLADLTDGDFEDGFTDKGSWPDGVQKLLFCDELAWTLDEIVEHCEGFGSQLYCLRASPQALVSQVQGKGVEDYAFFVSHSGHRTLPKLYERFMTYNARSDYCPFVMEGWQYKAAFVIQFRPETDTKAGRFEGRVEHIASTTSTRFHSLEQLMAFIDAVLTEVRDTEQP